MATPPLNLPKLLYSLTVKDLSYFVALALDLNLSEAAKRVAIAESPLSRAIKGLEDHLGKPLFVREKKKYVGLTFVGEQWG